MNLNKILIIDNNADSAAFCKNGLEDDGFRVDIADNFSKLIRMLEDNKYDLVILDINFITVKEYYSLQNTHNDIEKIPLIISTDSSNLNKQVSLLFQADACIPKSTALSVLKERVRFVLAEFITDFREKEYSSAMQEYF